MSEETKDAIRESLNASLGSLETLLKSDDPSDEQLESLLEDEDVAERVEEMLKAKKKKNNDDDDDDEDKDKEKGDVPEQFKSKEDETDGDDTELIEEVDDEEVSKLVSGVPVLKAFEKKLDRAVETLTVHSQVLKSLIESQVEQANLAKSTSEAVDVFRAAPRPRKAVTATPVEVLNKNFEGGEGQKAPEATVSQIKQTMQKAFNDGEITMTDVSRCEMDNWNIRSAPASIVESLTKATSAKEE